MVPTVRQVRIIYIEMKNVLTVKSKSINKICIAGLIISDCNFLCFFLEISDLKVLYNNGRL